METIQRFQIDGKWFEVRSIDAPKEQEAPKVSLSDVFVANDSRWWVSVCTNKVCVNSVTNEGKSADLHNLPTERDAKRIQAYIALINCAKYFNREWDGKGNWFTLWSHGIVPDSMTVQISNEVRFATEQGATETVRILKDAGLYEFLFLE